MRSALVFVFFLVGFGVVAPVALPADDAPDRKACLSELRKVRAEKWCDSEERKYCLKMHGSTEWCDASAANSAERKILDKRLNDTYQKLLAALEERRRKSLRTSQRLWIQYHIAECNARSDQIHGGAAIMRNNVWAGCVNEFIRVRIAELNKEFCSDSKGCQ